MILRMARRHPDEHQHHLFDDSPAGRAMEVVQPATHSARLRELAARLDPRLHMGTSSWSFPGWAGLMYKGAYPQASLARHGLAAYAAHPLMRSVGLDRAYYQPLSVEEYAGLGAQAPADFRFVIKAHQLITRPDADESGRTFGDTGALRESGVANPLFLDAQYAIDRVVGPATVGLKEKSGPIVFQFPPLDLTSGGRIGGAAAFVDRVGEFLARLPRPASGTFGGPLYAVEVRNKELLGARHRDGYIAMLRHAGVAHGWVEHPTMPLLSEQVEAMDRGGYGPEVQPLLCLRWLLVRYMSYDGARDRYEPFTRIVDDDPGTRGVVVSLVRRVLGAGRNAWVIANNKAEGSAPLTIERIAEELAKEYAPPPSQPRPGDRLA
jgi:uncharacterized protein YecE (DUF72 family)